MKVMLVDIVKNVFFLFYHLILRFLKRTNKHFQSRYTLFSAVVYKILNMSGLNVGPSKTTQTIEFHTDEDDKCVEIRAEEVTVLACPGAHHNGSSKVKIHNIVDYCWEERYYLGQLLAVHIEGKYIAYGIKVKNSASLGKSSSVVRVVNRETSKRSLIKGLEGVVEDLAFAAIPNKVLLACVDTYGTLLVHEITEDSKEISSQLLLHVNQKREVTVGACHRVFWCFYIPDEDPTTPTPDTYYDEITRFLAVTRNNKIELWNVESVNSANGSGPFSRGDLDVGSLEIDAHSDLITDAAFSPDGTAIATASLDGYCKFYQVYVHCDGEPRCLHQWKPHANKSLSALFFLDDHKNHNPNIQFWKYAVTGAEFNTELKLWSCESWRCLQTIHFKSRSSGIIKLKAAMDLTAGFILMSDMFHRVLYVLQLQKENDETFPFVCSITEFKLPYAILSLAILDAGIKAYKPNSSFTMEDITTGGESEDESGGTGSSGTGAANTVVIKMFLVQPKSLQECQIVFQLPNHRSNNQLQPVISENIRGYSDGLSDLSVSVDISSCPAVLQDNNITQPINLMTPDEFSSPPVKQPSPVTTENVNQLERKAVTPVYNNIDLISPHNDPPESPQEGALGFTSGGSSPSREVQEILSLQESPPYYMDDSQEIEQQSNWINPPQISNTKSVGTCPEIYFKPTEDMELQVASMRKDINSLLQIVKEQSTQIKELSEELKTHDKGKIVEEALGRWWDRKKTELASDLEPIPFSVDQNALTSKLSTTLASHIHSVLSPTMISSLEELKEMVQTEVGKKLSTMDQLLRDNIARHIRSKAVVESISSGVISSATPAINQFYKEAFLQSIPMFEKACQNMFEQISDTFHKGTQEYVAEMERFSVKASTRTREEVIIIEGAANALTQSVQNFTTTIEKASKRLEESIAEAVNRGVRLNNGSVPRSRAVTPALLDSHLLPSQLAQLIGQGQYNSAFQQALSAADLSLVMFVCERVQPSVVFTQTGSLLQQHVLLSLIQQLSADMSHYTDLRHRYLEEAVMNLDTHNTATREHMPSVLTALHKQLQVFITTNPNSSLLKRVRMLQMAVQALNL